MPSMSYCRLENLQKDIDDILGAITDGEYVINSNGGLSDQYGDAYSNYEIRACKNLPALLRELANELENLTQ